MSKEEFDVAFLCSMGLILLTIYWGILRRSMSKESNVDLDDLLLEVGPDGKKGLSKVAFYLLGAFVVTSMVVVYQTLHHELSEFVFAGYCLTWISPLLVILAKKAGVDLKLPSLPGAKDVQGK